MNTPGTELALALQQLLDDYPTYDVTGDDETADAVLTVHDLTDPGRGEGAVDLKLTPGQVEDLLLLVRSELDTQRRAQSDGDRRCGHCGGTGESGALHPTTHVLAWFPGELLADDPNEDGWELFDVVQWRERGTPLARLGGTLADDAVDLLARVTDAIGDTSEVAAFQRGTHVIEDVGDPDTLTGPWSYPTFDIQVQPAEEPPADDGSRP
ncbi:hypothetical protein ACKI14_45090 [Streptomyces turgidiscabies]|uniref:hypothetical protein n=1 Tax=Streptomyces turgidiscabies TaxID=85558 RepID=UPI0038F728CC